jgi:stress response protein YsnF
LVAVYRSRADAERAQERLMKVGVPQTDIRMSVDASSAEASTSHAQPRDASFWDWLFGNDVPEDDRSWYDTNLRSGRTALSVMVRADDERERICDILEESDPVEFDHAAPAHAGTAQSSSAMTGTSRPVTPQTGTPQSGSGMDANSPAQSSSAMAATAHSSPATASSSPANPPGLHKPAQEGEQVIPVVKEELDVGKRASERSYRIRTYVVEKPVQESVSLRDERVVVERRPASGQVSGQTNWPQEREFEITERHEEPVVEKRARQTEEVVVRKEQDQRTETVRGTVRETKVDVDKETAGTNSPNPMNGKP